MSCCRWILLVSAVWIVSATNPDVIALLELKKSFKNVSTSLHTWELSSSNPCSWHGIKCIKNEVISLDLPGRYISGTLSPHIGRLSSLVHLNLSRNLLKGAVPVEIGNLANLEILDLHSNRFNGHIPESITKLKKIKTVDLSYNRLNGRVPKGISKESVKGNPGLCTSDKCSGAQAHSLSTAMLTVMITLLGLLSLLAIVGSIRWCRNSNRPFSELSTSKFDKSGEYDCATDFPFDELKMATAEFDEVNIIGKGLNSVVYKGRSSAGYDVAVKQLINVELKVNFQRELEVLARARHKNIASLLGFCYTRSDKFLVSQYVPCLSLAAFLSGQRRREFDWEKRKAIILGIAKGIAYLHSPSLEIIHGGVKPSNILIEDDLTPKLTDHGLYTLLQGQSRDLHNAAYEPPEVSTGQICLKSDSYAFGVLLVQMMTGLPAWMLLDTVTAAGVKLREWVLKSYDKEEFVDEEIRKAPFWEVKKIAQLSTTCMEVLPVLRPRMDEIVHFLLEELLISNKSSELDGLFIELTMENTDMS